MQFYNVFFVVILQLALVNGRHHDSNRSHRYKIRQDRFRECAYKGYVPGGKVKDVGKIKAPVATMAKSGISTVLDGVSATSKGLSKVPWEKVLAVTKVFAKVAPKMGPVLGVFGIATGFISSLTKPKPQDILNAANLAIAELARDINEKLTRMQGYVDSQIITLERGLIEREYQTSFNLWSDCAREPSVEMSNECQRDAYHKLKASLPKFAIHAGKLERKSPLTGFEARELEAYLVSFRDYANLVVMMLKPLIETYAEDHSATGRSQYERYKTDLKTQTYFFAKYAQDAVNAIVQVHRGTNDAGVCPNTVSCGPLRKLKEGGLIKKHTCNLFTCNCIIEDGTKQSCLIDITMRVDHKLPQNYWYHYYPQCRNDECAAKVFTTGALVGEARRYQQKNLKVVKGYWKVQLLEFIPQWRRAFGLAKSPFRRISKVRPYDAVWRATRGLEFSPRFAARLKAAKHNVKKWRKH